MCTTWAQNTVNTYKYSEEQALLRENQHGFCKGKSCLTNLLEFFEKVNRHVGAGEPVDNLSGFSEGIDMVPH